MDVNSIPKPEIENCPLCGAEIKREESPFENELGEAESRWLVCVNPDCTWRIEIV